MNAPLLALLADRPIAYHPILARFCGGVAPALFLSQLLYWRDKARDPEGWVYKTMLEWTQETGLTRREQQTARVKLKSLGLLKEERAGMPARLFFQVDEACLCRLLETALQPTTAPAEPVVLYDPVATASPTTVIMSTPSELLTPNTGTALPISSSLPGSISVTGAQATPDKQGFTKRANKDVRNVQTGNNKIVTVTDTSTVHVHKVTKQRLHTKTTLKGVLSKQESLSLALNDHSRTQSEEENYWRRIWGKTGLDVIEQAGEVPTSLSEWALLLEDELRKERGRNPIAVLGHMAFYVNHVDRKIGFGRVGALVSYADNDYIAVLQALWKASNKAHPLDYAQGILKAEKERRHGRKTINLEAVRAFRSGESEGSPPDDTLTSAGPKAKQ